MSRADSQARTRAALLREGRRLFAKRGFNATTIEAIADKAGFTRGAFYANFVDKADLFLTIVEQDRERDFGGFASELESIADDQILERFGEWTTATLVAGPLRRAFAEFSVAAGQDAEHRRRLAENLRAIRAISTQTLTKYCERNDVRLTVDHSTFAAIITATVSGFAEHIRLDPESVSTDTLALALTALWDGVQASD